MYIAGRDSLDQFLFENPPRVLGRRVEAARVTMENPYILGPHLLAAAHEAPLDADDEEYFGPAYRSVAKAMMEDQGAGFQRRPAGLRRRGQPGAQHLAALGIVRDGAHSRRGRRVDRDRGGHPRPERAASRRDLPPPRDRIRGGEPGPPSPTAPSPAASPTATTPGRASRPTWRSWRRSRSGTWRTGP